MAKKKKQRITKEPEQILRGIQVELRSIIRQLKTLYQPVKSFQHVPNSPQGIPQYYVIFDNNPLRKINGLKACIKILKLPDEKIQDEVLRLAESVWQLKDRLNQWARVQRNHINVEKIAQQNKYLLICADLANNKKHGGMDNRSGLGPKLDEVSFDTSKSGMLELFYEGDSKEKVLLVTNPVPISYSVNILTNNGQSLGDAVGIISKAFIVWLPVIQQLNILSGNAEGRKLAKLLSQYS